ncbi:tetratricopeptide repeat protein [Maridesulfovibrio zosterae]|uniref:tetratricopeptide repeat protein n=1 Tax=Maridesulfovibrio zosterae TaxID=82171 RepID=UPI0003FCA198|nr:tetratricopeptide repeat protein [Maridesulfovibrio zosterae]
MQKKYYFIQELENGTLEVQDLNENNLPSGSKLAVERELFLENYHPEPEFYAEKVLPGLRMQSDRIKRGETHRRNNEVYSAEHEFTEAISIDEYNVKANFGLGLTYLDRGEVDKANDVFNRLVKIKAAFEPEQKHLFNEFGISLRKNKMYSQALKYYHKAEEISSNDENLFLNIARAYYENGDVGCCINYLNKALELDAHLEEACLFMDFLKNNGFISAGD